MYLYLVQAGFVSHNTLGFAEHTLATSNTFMYLLNSDVCGYISKVTLGRDILFTSPQLLALKYRTVASLYKYYGFCMTISGYTVHQLP